jgi:two-component system response regulator FlrC
LILKQAGNIDLTVDDNLNDHLISINDKAIITKDESFLKVLKLADSIAPTSATVLIQGESGTGKELLAKYIHKKSMRKGLYIAVNCAALPENLAESELFGHEKGAFTGAIKRKFGKFELAEAGTIVLDEISELSMATQAKILRTLQEKTIDRIGGSVSISVNFRLIAISNVDLKFEVKENRFRKDLFYRLNVIPFEIPPLRSRKADIDLLVDYFLIKYGEIYSLGQKSIDEGLRAKINNNRWEGNVRELENAIERSVLLSQKQKNISSDYFIMDTIEQKINKDSLNPEMDSLKTMEKKMIFRTLKEVHENRTEAARRLGISIRTLRNKLNDYKAKTGSFNQMSAL